MSDIILLMYTSLYSCMCVCVCACVCVCICACHISALNSKNISGVDFSSTLLSSGSIQ